MLHTLFASVSLRLILGSVVTLLFLATTTSLIVLWTPDQAGFPDTVLALQSVN